MIDLLKSWRISFLPILAVSQGTFSPWDEDDLSRPEILFGVEAVQPLYRLDRDVVGNRELGQVVGGLALKFATES